MATANAKHVIEAQIPALRRFAFALIRDRDAADDLVQDCLARALSRWHLLRSEAELRAWLFRMLRNLHIDNQRKRARRGTPLALDSVAEPSVEGGAEQALHLGEVMAALARLPEDQQEVLLLVGVEDFSYAEVAGILRIPLGTVMSRLSRGRAALREMTGRGQDDGPGGRAGLRRVK